LSGEFNRCRMDAGRIGDIHSQYPQFVVAFLGKAAQF
jgi:hypothetical protein